MKTSNKLFGLALLLVLTLPLLVVLFLKKSVREGDYTIINSTSHRISRGTYKPYKTLKITAPNPHNLQCYFFPADSSAMTYSTAKPVYGGGGDNVRIYNSGDTLYVQYVEVESGVQNPGNQAKSRRIDPILVNLHVSSFEDIVIDGGQATLDSLWRPAKFHLINRGTLILATTGKRTVRRKSATINTSAEMTMIPIDSTYSGNFSKLHIVSNDGYLYIGNFAWVRDLELDFRGKSSIGIDTTAFVDRIAGTISSEATVAALPGIMSKLQPLITDANEPQ